eukprot:2916521-Alexandrium_andersonii.AAC.1
MGGSHTSPETDFIFANRPDVFDAADKSKKRPHANAELIGIRSSARTSSESPNCLMAACWATSVSGRAR